MFFDLPVLEDAVGDVAAHDGVHDEKEEDGEVKPDELVQLAIEETGPKKERVTLKKSLQALKLCVTDGDKVLSYYVA